jgi:hypothetical protein
MREWLIRSFEIVGIQGQSWMLVALATILVAVVSSRSCR